MITDKGEGVKEERIGIADERDVENGQGERDKG